MSRAMRVADAARSLALLEDRRISGSPSSLQRGYHTLKRPAARWACQGNLRGDASREPFNLLQLDTVPGRVADYRVKATAPLRAGL